MKLSTFCERGGYRLKELEDVLDKLPGLSAAGSWLAGGALRRLILGTDPLASDLDFFFASSEQADSFEEELTSTCSAKRVASTKHAKTYRVTVPGRADALTVQSIRIGYYASLAECLDSFDFTICQVGFDGEDLVTGEFALWDIGRKRLVVHKVSYATATVRRLIKYTSQGFFSCTGAIQAILSAVVDDPGIVNAEVEYVD